MLNVRYDQTTREWGLSLFNNAPPALTWKTLDEARAFWTSMNIDLRPDGENRYRLTEHPRRWGRTA